MVTFLPKTIRHDTAPSEQAVLRAIDAALDDSWLCLHGIEYEVPRRLQRKHGKSGEFDLMVVHRDYGFFPIEVKGGMYVWDQTSLRTPSGTEIRPTPRTQNFRTRESILEFAGTGSHLPFELLASFPDMDPIQPFGPTGYERSVLWRTDLEPATRLRERLIQVVGRPWREADDVRDRVIRAISEWLCPSGKVPTLSQQVRYVNDRLEAATTGVVQLFEGQIQVAQRQNVAMKSVTSGSAGTGKSLLAVERARRLARLGYRVLFFTPNPRQHSEVVEVLAREGLLAQGNRLDATEPGRVHVRSLDLVARSVADLNSASSGLVAEVMGWDVMFDALIVDECQDLHEDLFSALEMRLDSTEADAQIHMFGDIHQAAGLPRAWQPTADFTPLYLSVACRSAEPIQTMVNLLIPTGVDSMELNGPPIRMIEAGTADAVEVAVQELKFLTHHQALRADQIQVLVAKEPDPAWAQRATGQFRRVVLGMRPSPRLPLSPDAFKGCEADAVVLVCGASDLTDSVRRELYVGLSRAKAQLSVVAPAPLLAAIAPSPT